MSSTAKKTASAEDQLQINKFARLHNNFLEVKNELTLLNSETQNLADAEDEIMLLDDSDAQSIPVQVGSIFVHCDQLEAPIFQETTSTKLEEAKEKAAKRTAELKLRQNQLDTELKQLRAILYAKFGDNIHLEMESDD